MAHDPDGLERQAAEREAAVVILAAARRRDAVECTHGRTNRDESHEHEPREEDTRSARLQYAGTCTCGGPRAQST